MNDINTYSSFPLRYVLISNAVNLAIYTLGALGESSSCDCI